MISRFFRWLLCSCPHEWKIMDTVVVYRYGDKPDVDLPIGRKVILQCQKCGNVKKKWI